MNNFIKTILKAFIFLLITNSFVFSQETLKKVKILGNDRIPEETIIVFSDVRVDSEISEIKLNEVLKSLYETNFFKDVQLSFEKGVLTIIVKENPVIGNINFTGIKANKIINSIKENLSLKERASYTENILEKDKEKIYETLRRLGYYFSKVDVFIENKSKNIIDISYDIELGNKTKISKIKFTGNNSFKENKLKSVIVSEEYKPWKFISGRKYLNKQNVELDNRLIKNFYLNNGFYNIEVNSSFAKLNKNNDFELVYNIVENKKLYFGDLTLNLPINYNKVNYEEILKLFSKLKNKPYSISRIEKILNEIDKISINQQFETINSYVLESFVEDKINLEFNIDESEKIIVKKINILGNNITKENVIRNQLELDEGDPYNKILATKSVNNLRSLNFFKKVNLETKETEPGSKILNILVEEKPTGEISAGAGVGTEGGTISFGVRENNYLGTGVKLDANMTITEDSLKGLFSVKNPNFKNTDKSLYTSIQATELNKLSDFGYKTSKTGISTGTGFEYYQDLNLTFGVNAFYENIEVVSTASDRQKTQAGNYFDTFLNLDFTYDKRDQKFQTTDGFISNYSIDLPILSDSNTLSNTFTYTNYYKYFEQSVFKSSLFLKSTNSLSGNNIKLSERNYIPSSRLRGFEFGKIGPKDGNDFVGGNYAVALNFSSSIPKILENIQSTDFSIFMDVANLWGVDYNSALDYDKIRSSVGIGLDYLSPIGPLSFSLSHPITKDDTDVTQSFRFNLGTTF